MLAKVAAGSHVGQVSEKRWAFRDPIPEPLLFNKESHSPQILRKTKWALNHTSAPEKQVLTFAVGTQPC